MKRPMQLMFLAPSRYRMACVDGRVGLVEVGSPGYSAH